MDAPHYRLYSHPESRGYRGYHGYQGYALNPDSDKESYLDDTDSLSAMSNYQSTQQTQPTQRFIKISRTDTHLILTQSQPAGYHGTDCKNQSNHSNHSNRGKEATYSNLGNNSPYPNNPSPDMDNTCAFLRTESIFDTTALPSNAIPEDTVPSDPVPDDKKLLRDKTNKVVVETLMKHLALSSAKTDKKSKGFKKFLKKGKKESMIVSKNSNNGSEPVVTERTVEQTSHLTMSISNHGNKGNNGNNGNHGNKGNNGNNGNHGNHGSAEISVVEKCTHVHSTAV